MPRRRRMGSQSAVERSWTRTSPFVGSSIPLINLRRVVLPLPLRPRRTRVSPSGISKETPETIKRLRISFMRKETSRNSIVLFEESAGFVFISIDSRKSESDHFYLPSLPTPNFGASFAWKLHPREGVKRHGSSRLGRPHPA